MIKNMMLISNKFNIYVELYIWYRILYYKSKPLKRHSHSLPILEDVNALTELHALRSIRFVTAQNICKLHKTNKTNLHARWSLFHVHHINSCRMFAIAPLLRCFIIIIAIAGLTVSMRELALIPNVAWKWARILNIGRYMHVGRNILWRRVF